MSEAMSVYEFNGRIAAIEAEARAISTLRNGYPGTRLQGLKDGYRFRLIHIGNLVDSLPDATPDATPDSWPTEQQLSETI